MAVLIDDMSGIAATAVLFCRTPCIILCIILYTILYIILYITPYINLYINLYSRQKKSAHPVQYYVLQSYMNPGTLPRSSTNYTQVRHFYLV